MYFKSLQVMRGLAAMAVVLFHANCYLTMIGGKSDTFFRVFGDRFSYGAWFFFVLSGFMMAYLIDTSYPRFLTRRLARIYPSFWLAAVITIVVKVIVFDSISQPKLLSGLTLLPFGAKQPGRYPLGIEWTLIYEIFFYAVCSVFAIGRLRGYFLHFLAAWAAALLVGNLAFNTQTVMLPTVSQIPFSLFNLLFVMGGLTYYASKAIEGSPFPVSVACIGLTLGASVASGFVTIQAVQFSCLGLAFSSLILFGVLRDRGRAMPANGSGYMEKWGDYSYGLYLIHVPVITIILAKAHFAHHIETTGFVGTVAVAAALAAGWYFGKVDLMLHRYFKKLGSASRPDKPRRVSGFQPMGLGRKRGVEIAVQD